MERIIDAMELMAGDDACEALAYCEEEMTALLGEARQRVVLASRWRPGRDVLAIVTPTGHILEISDSVERHAGESPADLVGRPLWSLAPEGRREARRRLFRAAVVAGRPLQVATQTDWGMMEICIHPVNDRQGCQYVLVAMRLAEPGYPWRQWRGAGLAEGAVVYQLGGAGASLDTALDVARLIGEE